MSRFGCEFWSPNSEIFVMSFIGMAIAATEDPVSLWQVEFDEVWYLTLPSDKFSQEMETLIRIILLGLVTVRSFTAHAYIVTFMILLWPLFLEEHRALITPWLVLSGLRNLVVEFVALVTGAFICYQYGCLSTHCTEFLIIKGICMSFSTYLWTSVAYFYSDLAGSDPVESHTNVLYDKKLELALRRRMCKSMADERILRRRLMEAMAEDGETVRVSVSLEENVNMVEEDAIVLCRKRSLDSMMDHIQTDWDQMEFLIERRREEGEQLTLKQKAKAFLRLSTLEIQEAVSKSKIRKRELMANTGVQTDTFSKQVLETLLRKSTLPTRFDSAQILRSASESSLLPAVRKLSPMSYITMPPKFGYRHSAAQTNCLSKKFLEDMLKMYDDEERAMILRSTELKSSHSLINERKSKRVVIDESVHDVEKVNNVDGFELTEKIPGSILKVKSGALSTDSLRKNLNDIKLLSAEAQSKENQSAKPALEIKPPKKESTTHIEEENPNVNFSQTEAVNILEDLITNLEVDPVDREIDDAAFIPTLEQTKLVVDNNERVSSQYDGKLLESLEHDAEADKLFENHNVGNEDLETNKTESREDTTEQRILQVKDKFDDGTTRLLDHTDDVIESCDHDNDVTDNHDNDVTESRDHGNDVTMSRVSDESSEIIIAVQENESSETVITIQENESSETVVAIQENDSSETVVAIQENESSETVVAIQENESSEIVASDIKNVFFAPESPSEEQHSDILIDFSLNEDDSTQSKGTSNLETLGGKKEPSTSKIDIAKNNVGEDVTKIKQYGVDVETQVSFDENDSLVVLREKRRQRLEILEQKKTLKSNISKLPDGEPPVKSGLQVIHEPGQNFGTRKSLENDTAFIKPPNGDMIPSVGLATKQDSEQVTFNREMMEKVPSQNVGKTVSTPVSVQSKSESMNMFGTGSINFSTTDSLGFNPIAHEVSNVSVGTQASLNDGDSLKTVKAKLKERNDLILQQQRMKKSEKNSKDSNISKSIPEALNTEDKNAKDGQAKNFVVGAMLVDSSSQSDPFRPKDNEEIKTNKKTPLELREARLSASRRVPSSLQKINENCVSQDKSGLPMVTCKQGEAHLFRAEERNTKVRREKLGNLRSEELHVMWKDLYDRVSERELRIVDSDMDTTIEPLEQYDERPVFRQGNDEPMHESRYAVLTNSSNRLNVPTVDSDNGLTYLELQRLYQKEFLTSHPFTELALPRLGFIPTGKWSSDTLLPSMNEDDGVERLGEKKSFKKLHKTQSVIRLQVSKTVRPSAPKKEDKLKKLPPPQKDMHLGKRYVELYKNHNQLAQSVAPDYSWLDVLETKKKEESTEYENVGIRSGEASEWTLPGRFDSDDEEKTDEPTTSVHKRILWKASTDGVDSFCSLDGIEMPAKSQVQGHEEKEVEREGRKPGPESYKGKGKGKGKSQFAKSPKEDKSK